MLVIGRRVGQPVEPRIPDSRRSILTQVRHPGTADTIIHDFETMLWVADVASGLPALSSLRLSDTLNQFAAPLKEQVGPRH